MAEFRQNESYENIKKTYEEPSIEVKESDGKGNKYSLPYGLCKGEGIDTTGMTPREAWEAYTNKTGISKEQAEKEHWGKESAATKTENAPVEENKSKKLVWANLKEGDVVKARGLTCKVIHAPNANGRAVVEITEGEVGNRFLRKPGDRIVVTENSAFAKEGEVVESVSTTAENTPKTPEMKKTDQSPEVADMSVKTEENKPTERKFTSTLGTINEGAARRAKEMTSFFDYKQGSATAGYQNDVARFDANVNALIEKYKNNDTLTDDDWARVESIASKYAKNRADFTNEYNRISGSYPSWAIAGPAKYNVSKHQKKMNALDSLFKNQGENIDPDKNEYLNKIKAILSNANIKSDDSNAVGKLQAKYDGLKAELERGKQMNAYFRKNKTLVGFPGISDEAAKKFDAANASGDYFSSQPYAAYRLQNGNAELRRIKERIDNLNAIKTAATSGEDTASKYPTAKGVTVQENADEMRVQLRFEGKPDEETRGMLKSWGFRWSPSQGAWQRQLTGNGKYAAKQVMQKLSERGN